MKKLLIVALLFVGVTSFAQTPEQRNERQLQKLTSELNLDVSQQAQVKQLLADRSAKAEKLRESHQDQKESGTKATAVEREAFKNEMKAEAEANDAKMKAILNTEQYTKWHSLQQKKNQMRKRVKEYDREDN